MPEKMFMKIEAKIYYKNNTRAANQRSLLKRTLTQVSILYLLSGEDKLLLHALHWPCTRTSCILAN